MENKYNALYYFNKFSAIPEDKWKVGGFGTSGGARCALGHVDIHKYTNETLGLINLFTKYHASRNIDLHGFSWGGVANINDLGSLTRIDTSARSGKQAKESILCVLTEILMEEDNEK